MEPENGPRPEHQNDGHRSSVQNEPKNDQIGLPAADLWRWRRLKPENQLCNRAAAFGSCRCLETNVDNVFISGTCVRGPNGLAPLLHDLCQSCDHVPPSSWFWPCLLLRHCKLFISEYLNILLSTFSTFCPESDNVPAGKSIQGLGENLIGNRILTAH